MSKENFVLFLESDDYGREPFYAESKKEAMVILWELYQDAMECAKDDGIERRVGLLIPVDEGERENDEE